MHIQLFHGQRVHRRFNLILIRALLGNQIQEMDRVRFLCQRTI